MVNDAHIPSVNFPNDDDHHRIKPLFSRNMVMSSLTTSTSFPSDLSLLPKSRELNSTGIGEFLPRSNPGNEVRTRPVFLQV